MEHFIWFVDPKASIVIAPCQPACRALSTIRNQKNLSNDLRQGQFGIFDKVNRENKKKELVYSIENISTSSKNQYLKKMISKMGSFIKRLRWKTFLFDFKSNNALGPQQTEKLRF